MTSLRLMNGDGSRAMLNLLGDPSLYAEGPYLRLSNVLLQWPYLIIGNLVNLKINEARLWISFSYSSMPLFFLVLYGCQSLRTKNFRWTWAVLGLICIVYLPQAFNAFNTVVESSFLFLLYLFIEKIFSGYYKNIPLILIILSFVCSHEISLAYTGFIFLKPIVDHFLTNKKISIKWNWLSVLGFLGSISILIRYFRLPAIEHVDYKSHFLSYLNNPDLKVTIFFIVFCYLVTFRKNSMANIVGILIICALMKASFSFYLIELYHYTYRLITPVLTLGWCLLVYYRTNILDSKRVQVLILVLLAFFSVKDMELSKRWSIAMDKFMEYSMDKPFCYTENDQNVMNYLRQYGYFDRMLGMHVSVSMSPTYEDLKFIFLPTPGPTLFDPCKHIEKDRIQITENKKMHFYFDKLRKFNWVVLDSLRDNKGPLQ